MSRLACDQLNVSSQVAQRARTGACTWVYGSICMGDLSPFHHTAPPALQTLYPPRVWGRLQISDADDGRLLSSSGLRSVARARVGRPGWHDRTAVTVGCQTHWSSSPRSHDPSHVTLAGVANSVAALASSCSGKTFQQLASDCSRNICNVRHWWEPPPPPLLQLQNLKIIEVVD